MSFKKFKIKDIKNGQVMILTAVFFMAFTLIISFGLTNPIIKQARVAINIWRMKESFYLAESGLEDVIYRVKNNITIGASETILINGYEVEFGVEDTLDGKVLSINSDRGGYEKRIEAIVKKGAGVSFVYGIHTGLGGLYLADHTLVEGNVFSIGEIIGEAHCTITGSAISANRPGAFLEQSNSTPITPLNSIIFGKTTNEQDFAQSFKLSTSTDISQINLYIKKVGSPNNIKLYLVKDSGDLPSGSDEDIISSIIIPASIITTNYGWVEIPLPTNSLVLKDTTYWIVLDAPRDENKYYILGANTDSSYLNGKSITGENKKTWVDTGYDGYFKIFSGYTLGKILGIGGGDGFQIGTMGNGLAYAHTVSNIRVNGELRCQVGNLNNKECDTSYPDPSPTVLPVSDANIESWKEIATEGGIISGNYSLNNSQGVLLGPKKITGNLSLSGNTILTITGTLYVAGDISLSGSSKIKLSSTYGENSGVIVSDGRINLPDHTDVEGSGQDGSYILMVTTSDCPSSSSCNGLNAVEIGGHSGATIINAQKGTVNLYGQAGVSEATANRIVMNDNATLTYENGVANSSFVDGPSGGFDMISWKELEN